MSTKKFDLLREKIEGATKLVIFPHKDADGDAIGSSLAWSHLLKEMNKDVSIVFSNAFPTFYSYLPFIEEQYTYTDEPEETLRVIGEADLLFFLDFNDLGRISTLREVVAESSAYKIMIDHHVSPNEEHADLLFVEPSACATGQLIFEISNDLFPQYRTQAWAESLLTAIVTDTGFFNHNTNGSLVFEYTAALIKHGASLDKVREAILHSYTVNRFKLKYFLLGEKCKLWPDHKMACISFSTEEQIQFDMQQGDTEGIVNVPLSIADIHLSVLFTETPEYIKVSLRSKGDVNVNLFARTHFEGGGHKNAAGGVFRGTLVEAQQYFAEHAKGIT